MIHEVTGDILLTKAQAIAHGVAPNDHFETGLALALRERWPEQLGDLPIPIYVYSTYQKGQQAHEPRL